MRFKCCKGAISDFRLMPKSLSFCCCQAEKKYDVMKDYRGELDFVNDYIKTRNAYVQDCKNMNDISEKCEMCPFFEESDWDETLSIKNLYIMNRTKCSCDCTYCLLDEEKRKHEVLYYDEKPVLMELEKSNLFSDGPKLLSLAGGEPSEYAKEDLKWILDYGARNNFHVEVCSSGLFYSEVIENALKNNHISLIISVDSGSREIYEKIKRINGYDRVWENIKKYIQVSKDNINSYVGLKYIILPYVNDNFDEFNNFLQKCNEVECEKIYISLEYSWAERLGKKRDGIVKLIQHIESLGDERINTDFFKKEVIKKTSAREYSLDIEDALKNGNTKLNVMLFAGRKETYIKLTNSDLFDVIFDNINRYNSVILNANSNSEIRIQYKIIPNVNDSLDELKSLISYCNKTLVKYIDFDIYDSKKSDMSSHEMINRLRNIYEFMMVKNNINVVFSDYIKNLINI